MRVVVGLGNPGSRYIGSRHNVGFAVIEQLARRWHLVLGASDTGLHVAEGPVAGERTVLVQPQMYMNCSGAALARLQPRLTIEDVIVVHDDLDFDTGCVRIKRGGGTGGHHGLDSVAENFGSQFTRLRIGIGRPPRGSDGADYVLARFDRAEDDVISAAVKRAADAVETIIRVGEQTAMDSFNSRAQHSVTASASASERKE